METVGDNDFIRMAHQIVALFTDAYMAPWNQNKKIRALLLHTPDTNGKQWQVEGFKPLSLVWTDDSEVL